MFLRKTARRSAYRVTGLASLCCAALVASLALAGGVTLDKPVPVGTTRSDKSKVAGRVSSFDEQGFEVLDAKDKATTVAWSELPARNAYDVFDRLLAKGTAEQWLTAGRVLYHLPEGKPQGEKAFARALRLDPKLKDQVEKAKTTPPVDPAAPPAAGGKEMLGEPGKVAGRDAVMKKHWAPETPEERAASVKELKEFAEKTAKVKDGSLKLLETEYFLFYTDLKPAEAEKWRGLLDKMYARLAELFAVEKGRNIWRGKALVFVFNKQDDYRKFELDTYGNVLTENSGGKCHGRGNGFVHIVFFRQPKELGFAQVLVHEATHGFVHRYRSHAPVPSWVNEGLADVMATELVPDPGRVHTRRVRALDSMRQYKGLGDTFFTGSQIEGWQYPIAENLSAFMIQQNKKGYVAFINAIKDGLSMDEALEQKYGANKERLVQAFLDHMGVKLKK